MTWLKIAAALALASIPILSLWAICTADDDLPPLPDLDEEDADENTP